MLNRQPVAVRLSKIIKKSWLKVDLNDDDSCRIHRIGLKKKRMVISTNKLQINSEIFQSKKTESQDKCKVRLTKKLFRSL